MSEQIKLTYFNARGRPFYFISCNSSVCMILILILLCVLCLAGRAEPIRYILALAGVKYEDHRIQREEWPSLKSSKSHSIRTHLYKYCFASVPLN